MDNGDDQARILVEHVLFRFAFHHYVEGLGIDAAVDAVRDEIGHIVEPMIARSAVVGAIPGVHIGDEFIYRAEMFLVGLHDDLVRGISLGIYHGIEVATCAVAVYELHDIFLEDDLLYYGGEGGELQNASRVHLRVLANQRWTRRNIAMYNSYFHGTRIRLLVRSLMDDNTYRYNYLGEFLVRDWREIMSTNGYRVFEFLLDGGADAE